ncbi:MAG: hypothetical protein WB711_08260 [Terriglobales bacterium]
MPDSTADKPTPQEIKAAKIRERAKQLTGIDFEGDFGLQLAGAVTDAVRVGAGRLTKEDDLPAYCCSEFHFAQYSGPGSTLVPLLYGISFHLSKLSGSFHLALDKLKPVLHTKDDLIYAAADLLVTDGFWIVTESENGKPVKYKPVGHTEWAQRHPGRCGEKIVIEYADSGSELYLLGKRLGSVLGGEKFHKNVLLGVQNAAPNKATSDEICAHAKKFMALDKGNGSGKERRKRFIEYLREQPENY